MKNSFPKNEKLCNYAYIEQLFLEGKPLKNFPLKMIYIPIETTCKTPIQVLVSVPRRNIKKAVTRNYIKRIIRESYRLQKSLFEIPERQFAIAFIYMPKQKINYHTMFDTMQQLAYLWRQEILENQQNI